MTIDNQSTAIETDPSQYERMPTDEIGFILIGPSGVGKSTLRDKVCEPDQTELGLVKYLPVTSRLKRPSEDGEYRFVSEEEMDKLTTSSDVIFGNTSYGNRFLTLWPQKLPQGQHYVYIYLPDAAKSLKETFPKTKIIQIVPPNTQILKDRILQRDPSVSEYELQKRVFSAEQEISDYSGRPKLLNHIRSLFWYNLG